MICGSSLLRQNKDLHRFLCIILGFLASQVRMAQNASACGNMERIVTYREINDFQKANLGYIIDVRTRKEVQRTGSLPNSVNIPRKFLNR